MAIIVLPEPVGAESVSVCGPRATTSLLAQPARSTRSAVEASWKSFRSSFTLERPAGAEVPEVVAVEHLGPISRAKLLAHLGVGVLSGSDQEDVADLGRLV